MELFHTPDTMPDAPNKGSNTRSKPAGLGNQVAELHRLGLLPNQEGALLPTPTAGKTGTGHPDRRKELNPKHSPELTELAAHGFLPFDEELPVLPTPSAVDGSGGSMQQSLESLREGRRQRHLTDLPRLLDLEAEGMPLLRTPQAAVTEPKPGIKLEGRRPSDPQVGLADQVLSDFHGDLLPTPVVNDMGAGKTPEQWDEWTEKLRAKGYNGNGHGNSLSVEVQRGIAGPLLPTPQTRDATGGKPEAVHRGRGYGADLNDVAAAGLLDQGDEDELLLLPTPMAQQAGNTPEGWLRQASRGGQHRRRRVGDLRVLVENGLLETGGELPVLPTPMARDHRPASAAEAMRHSPGLSSIGALLPERDGDEELLLPTPMTNYARGGPETFGRWRPGARVNDLNILMSNPELLQTGGELLPTPRAQEFSSGSRAAHPSGARKSGTTLNEAVAGLDGPLLPTPVAGDPYSNTDPESRKRRGYGPDLPDVASNYLGALPGRDGVKLLPTPTTLDHVEKRTTHAGGNPTLQGAVCGTNPVDAARLGIAAEEPPLLPTPQHSDCLTGAPMTDRPSRRTRQIDLSTALTREMNESGVPLLPTPNASDYMAGTSTLETRRAAGRQVTLPHVARHEFPLLPTPKAHDGVFGTPRTTGRPIEKSTHLQTIVSLMGLPGEDGSPLLPTPRSADAKGTDSTAERSRNTPGLGAIGVYYDTDGVDLLPTPTMADDGTRGSVHPDRRKAINPKHSPELHELARHGFLPADGGEATLMPTPQARDWKGAPGPAHNNGGIARVVESLAREADEPEPETVTGANGEEQFTLFPTPNVGASRAGASPGEMARNTPALGAVVASLDDGSPLLPTPNVAAREVRNSPGEMARLHPALGAVVADLAENGEGSRFHDLFPTPNAENGRGNRTPEGVARRVAAGDKQISLEDAVVTLPEDELLPTPTTGYSGRDPDKWRRERKPSSVGNTRKITDLQVAMVEMERDVELLPTPMSREVGSSPEKYDRWRDELKAKGYNGNGRGRSLAVEVQRLAEDGDLELLPTPTSSQGRNETSGRQPGSRHNSGTTLNDVAFKGEIGDLLPTPTSRDHKGRTHPEGGKVPGSTTRGNYLPDALALLPTPTRSDGSGGGVRTGLSWEGTTKPTGQGGNSRLRDVVGLFTDGDPVLPTPCARDGNLSTKDNPSRRDHQVDLPVAVAREIVPLLPTPKTAEKRTSRRAVMESHSRSGPSMGQALEIAQGVLPHEFDSWDELPPGWQPGVPLLPTPIAQDGNGHMQRPDADVGNNGRSVSVGDVVSRLPAGALTDPPDGGNGGAALLPTPQTINRSSRRAMLGIADPEGNRRHWTGPGLEQVLEMLDGNLPREFDSPDEIPGSYRGDLLPTPMTVNRTSRRAQTGRETSGPSRGGPSYGLEDVAAALFPTPRANASDGTATSPDERRARKQSVSLSEAVGEMFRTPNVSDGNGGGSDPATRGRHQLKLSDQVIGLAMKKEKLLPTPKAHQRGDCPSERERDSPDLAAATHHFPAGRWGKYGPAVARWEKLTRPAPAPTEPNKNGNPRLTARFSEWLLGWPEGWVTDPEIGVSRTGQLRLIGNGVVPQQAATALVILLRQMKEEREGEGQISA